MLASAVYYIEEDDQPGRSRLSHDGVRVASFETHEDAVRLAAHLAHTASQMGMHARVIERVSNGSSAILLEREPIDEADLPWDFIDG